MTGVTFLESAADTLVRATWQGAILAVVVLGICFTFRRIPARWRCGLWLVVLVRFLAPVTPPSTVSLFNLPSIFDVLRRPCTEDHALVDFRSIPNPLATSGLEDPSRARSTGSLQPELSSSAVRDRRWIPRPVSAAVAVWFVGFVAMLLGRGIQSSRLRSLLRGHRVLDRGPAPAILTTCLEKSRIRRPVVLLLTDANTSPAVVGLIRPRIIISEQTLATLSSDELRWLFRHELAHVRRLDVATQYLWWWARAFHWFNPLVWWAASRARGDAELACDESVLDTATDRERAGYGNALLRVAEMMLKSKSDYGTVAFLTREPKLSMRIGVIAGYRGRSLAWTILSPVLLLLLVCAGLTDAVSHPWKSARAGEPESRPSQDQSPTVEAAATHRMTQGRKLRIHVLGPDDKPLAGATIFANVTTAEPKIINRDYVCDVDGQADVELPKAQIQMLRLWARKSGYVAWHAHWWAEMQPDGHLIPAEYTFRLEKGTLIGSLVKNESGEPIAGVKVQVELVQPAAVVYADPRKNQRSFADMSLAEGKDAKTTDALGRWTLDNVPAGEEVEVKLMLSHPDYVSEYSWAGRMQKAQNISTRSLREGNAAIVMHRGISVTGFVIDADGKKIKNAIVMWGDDPYRNAQWASQQTRTDANGHYRFPPLAAGPITVTTVAKGWAPAQKTFEITSNESSANFQLRPGMTTRIRFVDEAGAAIPEVYVTIERWRNGKTLYNRGMPFIFDPEIPGGADRQGIYEWTWAPDDAVTYVFSKSGFQALRNQSLKGGEGEHVITLRR
jgi:beta-lactamase regulating signal transducer with metallopeptidase domain/protocatechuate 3,4-dioxygenase beta subunit